MKNVSLWLVTCACSGALALSGPADAQEGPRGGGKARGAGSVQQGGGNGGGSVQGRGNAGGVRGRGQAGGEVQRGETPSRGRASGQIEGEINRGSSQERGQREMQNRARDARESAQDLQERARQRSNEAAQQGRERSDSARESLERQRDSARERMENQREQAQEGLEQRRERMQDGENANERRSFRNPGALGEAQQRGENAAENAAENTENAANEARDRSMRGADRLRNSLSGNSESRDQRPNAEDQANRENSDVDRLNPERARENAENAIAEEGREIRQELRQQTDRLQGAQFRRWDNVDQVADRVRARVRSSQYSVPRFDQNFWQAQLGAYQGRGYYHVRGGRNYANRYWWNPTPWNRLIGWVSFRFNDPYYYTYGPGGDVFYRDGYVYVRGNRYVTIPEYYQQAVQVVRTVNVSEEDAKSMEWQPLGVYALSADESTEPSLVVQLAVNQEGILSGTFYDEKTEESRPLIGKVDRESQRAVWHFADAESTGIVMETTFANLSKEETSVLVHFGPEETESWLLVRLPAPEEL